MKSKGERALEALSNIVIILGVGFAALQYSKNSTQHAFDSSQSYVLHGNIERLYDARIEALDGIVDNTVASGEISEKTYENFNNIRLQERNKRIIEFEIAVVSLVQFYDVVGQCYLDTNQGYIQRTIGLDETCNKEILSENFVDIVNQILGYHKVTIEKWRPIFPGLGKASCEFLEKNRKKDHAIPKICEQILADKTQTAGG